MTTLLLADEMLSWLRALHSKGIVHRDVKPENFVLSIDGSSTLNIIDFGLSKHFID